MSDKKYVSWSFIEQKCWEIAQQIKHNDYEDRGKKIELVGISRGGVIPAVMISHHLGIRPKFVDIHCYNENDEIQEIAADSILIQSPNTYYIFIDDIFDTGATYKYVMSKYKVDEFITLIDKPNDPEYKDAWVVFPWEK